jgi:hypothetical protein
LSGCLSRGRRRAADTINLGPNLTTTTTIPYHTIPYHFFSSYKHTYIIPAYTEKKVFMEREREREIGLELSRGGGGDDDDDDVVAVVGRKEGRKGINNNNSTGVLLVRGRGDGRRG